MVKKTKEQKNIEGLIKGSEKKFKKDINEIKNGPDLANISTKIKKGNSSKDYLKKYTNTNLNNLISGSLSGTSSCASINRDYRGERQIIVDTANYLLTSIIKDIVQDLNGKTNKNECQARIVKQFKEAYTGIEQFDNDSGLTKIMFSPGVKEEIVGEIKGTVVRLIIMLIKEFFSKDNECMIKKVEMLKGVLK